MAGTALLVLAPVIYGIIAMNTGDLLWALPVFNAEPQAISIHCFGKDVPVEPGTADFDTIQELVNKALSGRKRWDELTLSEATYQDYQGHPDMMVLELSYASPLRVHSPYKFYSKIDTIIIPLEGRHAQTNAIFGRRLGNPAAGSFHVNTIAPIKDYLAARGLCEKP